MKNKFKRALFTAAITSLPFGSLLSADQIWTGATDNDMNTPTNWTSAVPINTDVANFTGTIPLDPTLSTTPAFNVLGFNFSGANSYTVTADAGNTVNNANMMIGASGVANTSGSQQNISAVQGGTVAFSAGSANLGPAGLLVYSVGSVTDSAISSLTFNGTSNASSADITLLGNNLAIAQLTFNGTSSLASSTITAVDNAAININTTTATSTAKIALTNSSLTLTNDLAVDTISSDGTSPIDLGANALTVNLPTGQSLIGAITGTGNLNVTGGELTLSGSGNTYSGGSFVTNGATLIGNTTSLQGSMSLNTGNLTFNQTTDGIFNGNIAGSAGSVVNKIGTGTLALTTPSPTFLGEVLVSQGILNLNTVVGGDIFVFNGGKLTGNGQIGGNLSISGGIVSPGNSIGVIGVAGNYSQSPSGIYEVEINGAGQSDLIAVGLNASLAGTVHVISLDGVINPANNYVIMHVEGTVIGEFQQVLLDNPLLVGQVFYVLDTSTGATNAILKVATIFTAVAMTSNEQQVANQLNSITNPTLEEAAILGEIAIVASTDPEAAAAILAQMGGQQYTNLIIAAELGNHQFLRRLYDPIRSIVTTYPCCQDYCCEPCPTLDLWLEGGGGRTFIQGTANTRGFHTDGWEITGGVQSTFNCDWTVGLAGSYANDQVRYNIGGSGKNRAGYAGLYGLYRPADWYVLADAAFGYSEHDVRRSISLNTLGYTARAKPKIYQGSGYIEAGIDCPWNSFLLQPFLGFEAGYYDRQGFTETGASPLNLIVSKKSHTNVYSRLGTHITARQLPWNLSLSVDLAWQYRITSLGNSINNRFESFGDSFTIKGLHFRNSSIDAAATLSAVVFDNWEVYLEAAGERWSRASTYNFLGGVKFSW